MRRPVAPAFALAVLAGCVLEAEGDRDDELELRADRDLAIDLALTPSRPSRLVHFTSEAPDKRIVVKLEMSEGDLDLLRFQPRHPLDEAAAERLGAPEEVVAIYLSNEFPEVPKTVPVYRGLYYTIPTTKGPVLHQTWKGLAFTADAFDLRFSRSEELPVEAFPVVRARARIFIDEFDDHNACYGEKDGYQICGDGESMPEGQGRTSAIYVCRRGTPVFVVDCGYFREPYGSEGRAHYVPLSCASGGAGRKYCSINQI